MNESIITTPGGRFHYLHAGAEDAPLVLCLHGFPDHPWSFAGLMERLASAGYRAVAPWMRGYSPSVLDGPYDFEQLGRDARDLGAALSPTRPFSLIGHDWGAVATFMACGAEPDRIAGAVAMAVPHPRAFVDNLGGQLGQIRRSWYMLFFQLPLLPERLVPRSDFALVDRLWADWSPGYKLPEDQRAALHACLSASMPAPIEYYRTLFRPPAQVPERLRALAELQIKVPLLHLHGERDGCVAVELTSGQERWFSGPFASVRVPGAGHFLHLEAAEEVAGQVLDWLGRHHGADQAG